MSTIKKLVSRQEFMRKFARNIAVGLLLVIFALFIGMLGYHFLEGLPWVDAFCDAAMILSGMGPVNHLTTVAGKIFAGCYALFSGLTFILIIGVIFGPLFQRFMHKMHLDITSSPTSK